MRQRKANSSSSLLFLLLIMVNARGLGAQSGTSGAISGTVTDASGAVIANASVTATEVDTKATRAGQTDASGHFLFSQVNPGTYRVTVWLAGFADAVSEPTPVGVGRNVALNLTLQVNSTSQTVEVTAQQGLLTLDNPNTSSTIEAKTLKSLPNPGQDLTYVTQFAQGALMNTAGSSSDAKAPGGYGNVEFNGLPATSNGYILDGFDSNDPWLGLNIGLSTNLVIGLDAVQESTVNTNSFSVDQGRYAVAQVNYFTKSGANSFHGDLYEVWNGSLFNAQDYFLHGNDTPGSIAKKPRSVVNEFGVSVGGPMRRDKLFFFTMRASALLCPSFHLRPYPHPPISNMCWGSSPRADTMQSREPIFRRNPRRFLFIKTCSRCCLLPAGRRWQLHPARWMHPVPCWPLLQPARCSTAVAVHPSSSAL
jgi:hypothetical protein